MFYRSSNFVSLSIFSFLLSLSVEFDVSAEEDNPLNSLIPDSQMVKFELPDSSLYEGPIKSGLFHGKGKLTWRSGSVYEGDFYAGSLNGKGVLKSKTGDIYKGEFMDGVPHGNGEWTYSHGDYYIGEHVDGLFHGKGIYKTSSGETYDSEFVEGKPDGKGEITISNGDHYTGDIKDWRMHGEGKYERLDSETYVGSFDDGYYHGEGTLTFVNGNSYTGEFKKGLLDGEGVFTDKSGTIFSGQFKKGNLEGNGEIKYLNGVHYKGNIKNWRPDGKGSYSSEGEKKYIGTFVNGSYEGEGELIYKNGDRYIGKFEKGRKHGEGKYIYKKPMGRKQSYDGIWASGSLVSKDGEEIKKSNNKLDKFYVEESLFKQATILDSALKSIEKGRPNIPELYFLSFGAYGKQDVFMKEAMYSRKLFEKQFDVKNKSIALINNRKTNDEIPMATVGNLKRTLNHLSKRMNVDEDILFLFVTSHGSKEDGLTVNLGGMYLHDLKAPELADTLKQSGIKWKVIVISACYSGTFVDELKDDYTMVITSSKPDHVSFGCSDEAEFTFFGRAYFEKAIKSTDSFKLAFEKAKNLINEWEAKEGYSHSEPQIASSIKIETQLIRWRNAMNSNRIAVRKP